MADSESDGRGKPENLVQWGEDNPAPTCSQFGSDEGVDPQDAAAEAWKAKREKVLKEYGLWERFKHYEYSEPGQDDG